MLSIQKTRPDRLRGRKSHLDLESEENMTTIKVIELIGASKSSWEDAASNAIKDAHATVSGITGLEVVGQTAQVDNGKIAEYRAVVKVAFAVKVGS